MTQALQISQLHKTQNPSDEMSYNQCSLHEVPNKCETQTNIFISNNTRNETIVEDHNPPPLIAPISNSFGKISSQNLSGEQFGTQNRVADCLEGYICKSKAAQSSNSQYAASYTSLEINNPSSWNQCPHSQLSDSFTPPNKNNSSYNQSDLSAFQEDFSSSGFTEIPKSEYPESSNLVKVSHSKQPHSLLHTGKDTAVFQPFGQPSFHHPTQQAFGSSLLGQQCGCLQTFSWCSNINIKQDADTS